jgi:hypothetical protein
MASFLWGSIGGMVAWVATTILGQPIYRFINLRAEAAEALARYERRDPDDPDPDTVDVNWLAERKRAYRECGSRLVAFAASNVLVTRLLCHPVLRKKYYPRSAGQALIVLGDLSPGAQTRLTARDYVISGLKLRFGPAGLVDPN